MAGRSIPPRRALWLIAWLPEGSAFVASLRGGPQHRAWTVSSYLAAGAINALAAGNWQRGGGKGRKPQPITGPKTRSASGGKQRQSIRDWRRRSVEAARRAAQQHRTTED